MIVVIIVIVALLYILITMMGDKAHPDKEKDKKTVWLMNTTENSLALTLDEGTRTTELEGYSLKVM